MGVHAALSALIVATLELLFVLVGARLVYALVARGLARAAALRGGAFADATRAIRRRIRNVLIVTCVVLTVVIVASNAWLAWRGLDAWTSVVSRLGAIGTGAWLRLAVACAKLAAAALGFLAVVKLFRRLLAGLETSLSQWDALRGQDRGLEAALLGLDHVIVNTGWLLLVLFAFWLFAVPDTVAASAATIVRAYVVVAVGVLLVRSSGLIVDTLDASARRYVQNREWRGYFDHLHSLVPTFRACLEYVLWIATIWIALAQLGWIRRVADLSPRLIQAIGLFFIGRVVVELGHVEIARRMLAPEGLDETARRRRATIAPIVRSAFTYAVGFATAVAILALLGFNPMPFLAGAGILGLVIGFGAQSLIQDLVSGFFILFENTYLVGDAVEAAGAKGVVEAIEFRTTKIRDADGRLHIVCNGDVKKVVNYSKEYAMAVVVVDVAYDADLPHVFAILREAGERTRGENPDVLGDIEIDGISAFGTATMSVRTSTRVKPGRHEQAAAAVRLAIKEAFDRHAEGMPRTALVPQKLAASAAQLPDLFARLR